MNQSDRGYWLYLDWFLTAGITRANYCLYEQITNIIIERQYLTARINLWGDGRPCKSEEVSLERHKLGIFWKWLWKTSKYWERDSYQTIPTRWFWIHLRIKIHASFRATEPFRAILTDADVLLSEFNWTFWRRGACTEIIYFCRTPTRPEKTLARYFRPPACFNNTYVNHQLLCICSLRNGSYNWRLPLPVVNFL